MAVNAPVWVEAETKNSDREASASCIRGSSSLRNSIVSMAFARNVISCHFCWGHVLGLDIICCIADVLVRVCFVARSISNISLLKFNLPNHHCKDRSKNQSPPIRQPCQLGPLNHRFCEPSQYQREAVLLSWTESTTIDPPVYDPTPSLW